MSVNQATLSEIADSGDPVNSIGTTGTEGYVVRSRWNQTATVEITDVENGPALYTSKGLYHPWIRDNAQYGTDNHTTPSYVLPEPILTAGETP